MFFFWEYFFISVGTIMIIIIIMIVFNIIRKYCIAVRLSLPKSIKRSKLSFIYY